MPPSELTEALQAVKQLVGKLLLLTFVIIPLTIQDKLLQSLTAFLCVCVGLAPSQMPGSLQKAHQHPEQAGSLSHSSCRQLGVDFVQHQTCMNVRTCFGYASGWLVAQAAIFKKCLAHLSSTAKPPESEYNRASRLCNIHRPWYVAQSGCYAILFLWCLWLRNDGCGKSGCTSSTLSLLHCASEYPVLFGMYQSTRLQVVKITSRIFPQGNLECAFQCCLYTRGSSMCSPVLSCTKGLSKCRPMLPT